MGCGDSWFDWFVAGDEDLELLASLLEENEAAEDENTPEQTTAHSDEAGEPDEYDELFDAEDDASYTEEVDAEESEASEQKENASALFGDVDDLTEEEEETVQEIPCSPALNQEKEKNNQDLQGLLNSNFCLICHALQAHDLQIYIVSLQAVGITRELIGAYQIG